MSFKSHKTGVLAGGLALFSMFFGAGNLIWPLILGGEAGDKNIFAVLGILFTGVSLPLLGLMAMMLFQGDYRSFFGKAGRIPGVVLLFLIQAILGPFGSIPRLITLSHATLKPYLPISITLPIFSVLACLLVFLFAIKRRRVIEIIGLFLCPILLLSLGLIFVVGFQNPPTPAVNVMSEKDSFFRGLNVGYNTLDLIASFIFASVVLSYFQKDTREKDAAKRGGLVIKKMIKSSAIAGLLISGMYIGLTFLSAHYMPVLPDHAPEERLGVIAMYLLGSKGAFFSCLAVSLSCLTTAIPISIISADYIHKDFMKERGSIYIPTAISLGLSAIVANLGFMGIADMLSPILHILCPGLILLCIFNILHKLYEMRIRRAPIFAAFAIALIGYVLNNMAVIPIIRNNL